MTLLHFDESIAGQNWVARALDVAELPPIEAPWPPHLQSGLDPDYSVYLPDAISGEVAAGEMFIQAALALEAENAPPPPPPPQIVRARHQCSHTSYRLDLPAGLSTPVFSADSEHGYALIVNTGPNDVFIAYGADADARGLLLAPGGDGFHELVFGTTSSLNVFSILAGSFVHIILGTFDPPNEAS